MNLVIAKTPKGEWLVMVVKEAIVLSEHPTLPEAEMAAKELVGGDSHYVPTNSINPDAVAEKLREVENG